jgi:hypothetical protein
MGDSLAGSAAAAMVALLTKGAVDCHCCPRQPTFGLSKFSHTAQFS